MTRCLVNPLCLFLLVWGVSTTLYAGGVYHGLFPFPAGLTVASVLLNVVAFSLGCLTWTLFRGLHPTPAEMPPVAGRPLTAEALVRGLRVTLAMGVVALALEIYRVVTIAEHFATTWLDLVTHPELFRIRMVAFIDQSLFQTSATVMLLSIASSLFSIGFVLLGVLLYLDHKRRRYFYVGAFLTISLVIGLIHLSRYEVTSNILYLVLAYCFMSSLDRSEHGVSAHFTLQASHFKLIAPVVAVVLLFGLIDALLHKSSEYDASNRLQGWLFHFYWYAAAPLAAFNEFLATFRGDHQWGQSMFLPLYKWLCRFQLATEVEVSFYGEKVLVPYMSNVYTYLRNFYEDFGILGVAIVPYILGGATAAVRVQARRHLQFLNLYLVLLLFILFSFYNYYVASNQVYLQVLFGFLFFRYEMPGTQRAALLPLYRDSST